VGVLQVSEVVNLVLAIFLVPLIVADVRQADAPSRGAFALGFSVMLLAYAVTIAEGFFLPDVLDVVEHALYATSGICFLAGLLRVVSRQGRAR
jgi:hypothetical protein